MQKLMLWGAVGFGCTADRSIPVEPNELGVVAIAIDRFASEGNDVFELRGLDAHDADVARVRLRTGQIADLQAYLPGESVGSELTVSFDTEERRMFSRELDVHKLPPFTRALQGFLELDEVSRRLREANILVAKRPVDLDIDETAYQIPPQTINCPTSYLLSSPVAGQCCWDQFNRGTLFVNPAGNYVFRDGPSRACTSQTGGTCSGAACYYGPNGFARAQIWTPFPGPAFVGTAEYDYGTFWCATDPSFLPVPNTHEFPNIAGSFPTGQGCPGGATGAGAWDYH